MKTILPSLWGSDEQPFASLQKEVDRVFSEFSKGWPAAEGMFGGKFPALDMKETETGVDVTAELPGVSEGDIDISLNDRFLTIKGEKKQEKEKKEKDYYLSERSYGSFRRTVGLPFAPDAGKVKADFENGVLTLHLPKAADDAKKEKKIKIGK